MTGTVLTGGGQGRIVGRFFRGPAPEPAPPHRQNLNFSGPGDRACTADHRHNISLEHRAHADRRRSTLVLDLRRCSSSRRPALAGVGTGNALFQEPPPASRLAQRINSAMSGQAAFQTARFPNAHSRQLSRCRAFPRASAAFPLFFAGKATGQGRQTSWFYQVESSVHSHRTLMGVAWQLDHSHNHMALTTLEVK